MKKLLIVFLIFVLCLTNIITSIELTKRVSELNKKVIEFRIEKIVSSKSLKLDISHDNNYLLINTTSVKDYDNIINFISNFEHINLLISLSKAYDLDWKLLAIQIFYESGYNPNAQSQTGAKGLMQITKFVYGKDADPFNQVHNIFVGISYFDYLYNTIYNDIDNKEDRIRISLAAYCDGPGSINIYRKSTENSNSYASIERFLSADARKYVDNIMNTYNGLI